MPGLQEYVIRLSTDVDNMGVQKLMSIMDTNKTKALGLTAALTAATTAVYKWVESATKQEMELDKLAKKQKKSIEQTRAEQEALKQMGMTLDEIKKDKALKEIYDDLVKFNKEMQMPNAANMLGKVRELQTAFWKLKSAVNYLVQSIGAQLLINLEKPIERITNTLGKGANWLKNNLTSIGTKITGYLTAFSKGIIGIVEGVGKIFNWLGQMPEGIKSIAGTLATVFALIKSGPIGQIMAMITAAGDLIHDYENSQWNKENRENTQLWNDGKGGYTDKPTEFGAYQVPLAYEGLWSYLDSDTGTLRDKAKTITESILQGITDALNGFTDTLNSGEGLTDWLFNLTGPVGEILGGVKEALSGEKGEQAIADVLIAFFNTAASLCSAAGTYGAQILDAVGGMIANIFGMKELWDNSNVKKAFEGKNGFANGLVTAIETALLGGNFIESAITGVLSGWQTERSKALKELYQSDHANEGIDWESVVWGENGIPGYTELNEMYKNDSRLGKQVGEGLQNSFNEFLKGLVEVLASGITIASDVAGSLLRAVVTAIFTSFDELTGSDIGKTISDAMNAESAKSGVDSIAAGIVSWIVSGNGLIGLLGSALSMVAQSATTAAANGTSAWDELSKGFEGLWDMILDIALGPKQMEIWYDGSGRHSKWTRNTEAGLLNVVKKLIDGETVGSILRTVVSAILEAFSGDEEGVVSNIVDTMNSKGTGMTNSIAQGIATWIVSGNFLGGLLGGIVSFISQSISKAKDSGSSLWDVMKDEVEDFWEGIQDIIYGPIIEGEFNADGTKARNKDLGLASVIEPILWGAVDEYEQAFDSVTGEHYKARKGGILNWLLGYDAQKTDEAGNVIEGEVHRVKGIFEKAWEGEDGQSGIKGWFAGLAENITAWLEPVGTAIKAWFKTLLKDVYKDGGPLLQWALDAAGYGHGAGIEEDESGNKKIVDEITGAEFGDNEVEDFKLSQDIVPDAQKLLEEFGGFFPINAYGEYQAIGTGGFDWRKGTGLSGTNQWGVPWEQWYGLLNGVATSGVMPTNPDTGKPFTYDEFMTKYLTVNPSYTPTVHPIGEDEGSEPGNTGKTTPEEPKVSGKAETETKGLPEPIGYIASAGMSDVGGMGRGKGTEEGSEASEGVAQLGKQSDSAAGSIGDMATDASNAGSTLERFDTEVDLAASKAETLGDKVKGASLDLQESSEHFKTVGSSLESITGSASGAKGAMDSLASGASHAAGVLSSLSAGGSTPGAMGGRFDRATEKRVGEAGTEYLIPITKPERAFSLILQALSEMGSDMIKRVTAHFGGSLSEGVYDMASGMAARVGKDFALGTSGTVGGSLGGIESALQNMQQNFNYNISAPVTIQVQSSGASAQEIGTAAYDAAERRLLKTLRGAYA